MVYNPFRCFIFTFHAIKEGFQCIFSWLVVTVIGIVGDVVHFSCSQFDAILWLIAVSEWFRERLFRMMQNKNWHANESETFVNEKQKQIRDRHSARSKYACVIKSKETIRNLNFCFWHRSSPHCFQLRNGTTYRTINIILVNILVICCMPTTKLFVIS